MNDTKQWQRGFTLLSMVIVLFIISLLLTATIIAGEKQRRQLTINTTLQLIVQHYEQTYHRAVAEGSNYYVIFGKDRVRYYKRGVSPQYMVDEIILPDILTVDRSHRIPIRAATGHVDPKTITLFAAPSRYYLTFQLGGQYEISTD
ncbi:MAG: type II secretion system GspH family protein [Aerococcus sp.]|nr:type II secretion system GspH family protein [Aerococcus sp.]